MNRSPLITKSKQESELTTRHEDIYARLRDAEIELSSDNLALFENAKEPKRANHLIGLLRELLVTDRWQHVPEVLACLLANGQPGPLYKPSVQATVQSVSLESFLQTMPEKTGQFATLIKKLIKMHKIDPHATFMTFFLHQICSGNVEEAKDMPDLPKIHPQYRDIFPDLLFLMKAYKGLLHYQEWTDLKAKVKRLENDEEYIQRAGSADELLMERQLLDNLARITLEHVSEVKNHREVWDIFISKEVEILEDQGKIDEAGAILKKYSSEHPNNFYALMSLYEFYKRNERGRKLQIEVLEEILRLAPFNEVVLDLYELYKNPEAADSNQGTTVVSYAQNTSEYQQMTSQCESVTSQCEQVTENADKPARHKACGLLFTLLDYPHWKDRHRVWQLLAGELETTMSRCEGCEEIRELWEDRKSWWPDYCFAGLRKNDADTVYWKTVCAHLLLGNDDPADSDMLSTCTKHLDPALQKQLDSHIQRIAALQCRHVSGNGGLCRSATD